MRPEPEITVSEWADTHRMLSNRSSAAPGRLRMARTPYAAEPLDMLTAGNGVQEVVLMWAAQLGKTESGNNWLGYIVDVAPAPTMYIQPTVEMAKRASKQRLDPLFEDTPRLIAKIRDKRSRDSGNTTLMKSFPGGDLVLTGANSAVGMRSMPCRNVFMDEIDSYPGDVEGEGDPVILGERGTRTYGAQRKKFKTSTPTLKGRSRIEHAYEAGDMRVYLVPCPFCDHYQRLTWKGIDYTERGTVEAPVYDCEECQQPIEERHKTEMLARGRWEPTNPDAPAEIRSYHLSSLYSPVGWFSWADCVSMFLKAKGKPDALRAWVNTVLGETWAEEAEVPDWEALFNRRESYKPGIVPRGGIILTAGVDVQADRVEVEVVAWGRERESWSVDYQVFLGDTDSAPDQEPWRSLTTFLGVRFPSGAGSEVGITRTAIDSGYRPQPVYRYVRTLPRDRVMAIKGAHDNFPVLVGSPQSTEVLIRGKRLRRGVKLWPVGGAIAKSELYGWLRIKQPTHPDRDGYPGGYCHFPQWPEEWFRQLCAEQLVVKVTRGYRRYEWEKTRERNEALDCRVYARAAAAVLGIDRWGEAEWTAREAAMGLGGRPLRRSRPTQGPETDWIQ